MVSYSEWCLKKMSGVGWGGSRTMASLCLIAFLGWQGKEVVASCATFLMGVRKRG